MNQSRLNQTVTHKKNNFVRENRLGYDNIRKGHQKLLELSQQLGNESRACKIMGYSRDSFYRFKELYEQGGKEVTAIELNYHHYSFIKRTAGEIGFKSIKVFKTDVFLACQKLKGRKFDIIFADPPYQLKNITEVPAAIFDNDLLEESGIAILEHPASVDYSHHPHFFEHRVYGSVNFSLFRKS